MAPRHTRRVAEDCKARQVDRFARMPHSRPGPRGSDRDPRWRRFGAAIFRPPRPLNKVSRPLRGRELSAASRSLMLGVMLGAVLGGFLLMMSRFQMVAVRDMRVMMALGVIVGTYRIRRRSKASRKRLITAKRRPSGTPPPGGLRV